MAAAARARSAAWPGYWELWDRSVEAGQELDHSMPRRSWACLGCPAAPLATDGSAGSLNRSLLPGLLLFPWAMLLLLALGMGLATIADSSIWVPKRFGIGWTLNWSKPLSWLVLIYTLGIVLMIVYGASHPNAPGMSALLQLLSRLAGGANGGRP